MQNPYSSPEAQPPSLPGMQVTPAVVTWHRFYSAFMALMYLMVTVGGIAFLIFGGSLADEETPVEIFIVYGVMLIGIGIVLLIMFAVGTFMPPKRWAWIYGIVLIGIGMTSCCFLPICIPLLIFWIKPETQAYFGRPKNPLPAATP